jgi:hypothetical protein
MVDIKRLLRPDDKDFINATGATNWVPPNPRDLLLPFIEEPEDLSDIDKRRQKAKEVYDGYTKLIEECKETEAVVSDRCKDVIIELDESKHFPVIEAIERVFGFRTTKITFQMYKKCLEEFTKIGSTFPSSR